MPRSVSAALCVLLAAVALVLFPPPARRAAAATSTLKVGVVYSDISVNEYWNSHQYWGGPYDISTYQRRVASTLEALRAEPGISAEQVSDDDLRDIARLRQFDAIVLPRMTASDTAQRTTLRQYVAEGGGLVTMFSPSRFDYRPGTSSPYTASPQSYGTPYWPINFYWGFSGSSYLSQSFEWGELSELVGMKFCNDPLFSGGYQLVSTGSSHPILQMTAADLGANAISFTDPNAQYNETVFPPSAKSLATPLLNYSGETIFEKGGLEDHSWSGTPSHMAAWAAPYYYGRMVSYGFQLYDLLRQRAAARVLVNSVKWAGTRDWYGSIYKTPNASISAWYTGGRIWARAGVRNDGNIQVRGQLKVEFFAPGASKSFASCYVKDPAGWIPLGPLEQYSDVAGTKPSVSPARGRWIVRASYRYHDFFRGGWVVVSRDGYLDGTGSGMTWRGTSGLAVPASSLPAPAGSSQLAGADRYATSAAISQAGWPSIDATSNAVILASGRSYADALAAAPLAGKLHAPILLTPPDTLAGSVAAELRRLYASAPASEHARLYVVSGLRPSVVSAAAAAMASGGAGRRVDVSRLDGADRFATARNIAVTAGTSSDAAFAKTAFVVTGRDFPDSLSIGPLAARAGVPILLVDRGSVPPSTQQALDALGVTRTIIVGGNASVSGSIERWLEADGHRGDGDERLQGANRYETCMRVLEFSRSRTGFSDDAIYVAIGTNYPDALALAPLAGAGQHPVLLTNGADIGGSPSAAAYLLGKRDASPRLTFAGDTAAVSAFVRGQMGVALGP